jgi:1-acyl-sn-glycerol-3-phosphate acyltransferase
LPVFVPQLSLGSRGWSPACVASGAVMSRRRTRIYFANHNSHLDFVLIWSVLPRALRQVTRPCRADYWPARKGRLVGERVFNAVLIDRAPLTGGQSRHPYDRGVG